MEESRLDILSEIKDSLASLKAKVAEIEARIVELENAVPAREETVEDLPEDIPSQEETPSQEDGPELPDSSDMDREAADMDPIDISIDMDGIDDIASSPAFDIPDMVRDTPGPVAAKAAEESPEKVSAPAREASEEEEWMIGAPKESINDKQEKKVRKAVMDVMGQKLAWKTAIPGTPVKNVISAISLNDRVLFINTLFKEDPLAFQEAISAFNAMSSFDEAEAYVRENHPDWNLGSDLVYRLMMAVRRKLR